MTSQTLLALLVLLVSASHVADARISIQEQLFDWLEGGSSRTVSETFTFNPSLAGPLCLAAFLDGPAWHHHKIHVQIKAHDQDPRKDALNACMAKNITWKAVVIGNDYMPDKLMTTVGFRGQFKSEWTAQVVIKPGTSLAPFPPPAPATPLPAPSPSPSTSSPAPSVDEAYEAPEGYDDAVDYFATEYTDLPATLEPGDYGRNYDTYDFNDPGANPEPEYESDYTDMPADPAAVDKTDGSCLVDYIEAVYNSEATSDTIATAHTTMKDCMATSKPQPKKEKAKEDTKKKRGMLNSFANIRRQLGLQPFWRGPGLVSMENPYAGWESEPATPYTLTNRKLFEVPENACNIGFRNIYFKPSSFEASERAADGLSGTHEYDSCFLTQTVVYISYQRGCQDLLTENMPPVMTITATYSPYTDCSSTWLVKMAHVLDIMIWTVSIPVGLVVVVVAGPTIWRMVSRPFVYLFVGLMPSKTKLDIKIKRWFRMDVDPPVKWKWVRAVAGNACLAPFFRVRKRVVYACTSITTVNGHSRVLQVALLVMCTVSVSLMVWKPPASIVLNSNPTTIALKLNDNVQGPLREMVVYFQIVGISMFYGVLGYMASIANINKPGTPYWTTQRVISILSMIYLCCILSLQIINIAAYLPMTRQSEAYGWIVAVQCVNIIVGLAMQVRTITRLHRVHTGEADEDDAAQTTTTTSKDPEALTAEQQQEQNKSNKAGSDAGSDRSSSSGGSSSQEEEEEPKWWQKQVKALKEAVAEESIEFTGATTGTVTRVTIFSYPSWFIAALVVALDILIFHFIKALTWAEIVGNCIITPDLCEFDIINKWANFFSSSQLDVVNAAYMQLSNSIMSLKPIQPVMNAVLAKSGTDFDKWLKLFNNVGDFLDPKTNKFYRYKNIFGKHFIYISKVAFSLGFILGLVTLFRVFMAFKATMKSSRVLKLLQRLRNAADASLAAKLEAEQAAVNRDSDDDDDDDARPTAGVQSGEARGTTTAEGDAAAAEPRRTVHIEVFAATTEAEGDGLRPVSEASSGEGLRKRNVKSTNKQKKPEEGGKQKKKENNDQKKKKGGLLACLSKKGSAPDEVEQEIELDDEWDVRFDAYEAHRKSRAEAKKKLIEETYDSFKPESLAAVRAAVTPIGPVMYFIGVLLSSTVVQLYAVGSLITIILAVLTHPAFWTEVAARLWPYVLIAVLVIVFNQVVIQAWIANRFVSHNGELIRRPAGWFAFMIIMSITNLVLGLFIAISRLIILLFTSIFSIGMLDRTVLSVRARMDMPYNCFLAGIRLQTCLTTLDQPHYRPGPKGRAARRWRAAKDAIVELGPDGYALLEYLVEQRAKAAAAEAAASQAPDAKQEAQSSMV